MHSRYARRLSDTAVAGQETMICPRVRQFFCGNPGCARKTFAEQVPVPTGRYGRRSSGLTGAAGDRAGAGRPGPGPGGGPVSQLGQPDDADPAHPGAAWLGASCA